MVKNELVKYHNDLNNLSIRQWSAEEMDLFFTVIAKIKNNGTDKLRLDAEELKVLTGTETRNSYWFNMLDQFTKKAISLYFSEKTESKSRVMTLFNYFEFNTDNRTLDVQVAPMFEYIVNKLTANFTVYELAEFTSLKSTYSKTMYRILKQWKSLGEKEFNINQFKELLDVPKSYTSNNIQQRVIKPIEKELPQYFTGLKIKPIKKNTQGTPVIAYKFTWQSQKTSNQKWIEGKYDKKSSKNTSIKVDVRQKELEEYTSKKVNRKLPNRLSSDDIIEVLEGQIEIK